MSLPVTAVAHPNVALIKYWGKAPGPFNRPAVPSLSLTLDTLEAVTTARAGRTQQDTVTWFDGGLHEAASARLLAFVQRLRDVACARGNRAARAGVTLLTGNNFPMAAGLASSAAGFAAAALAVCRLWQLAVTPSELSALAREGSGSAARSIFGGFVHMAAGSRADGSDAIASPVLSASAWPLRVVVAIVTHRAKAISSTEGMAMTQKTSPYFAAWLSSHANDLKLATESIERRDFAGLARATERSCLRMHASALAADEGLLYWQAPTLAIMHAVRALRAAGHAACFTIDAGPQVKVVCLPAAEAAVTETLRNMAGVETVVACGLGEGASLAPSERRVQPLPNAAG